MINTPVFKANQHMVLASFLNIEAVIIDNEF